MLIVIIFCVDYAIMYNDQIGANMSPCDNFFSLLYNCDQNRLALYVLRLELFSFIKVIFTILMTRWYENKSKTKQKESGARRNLPGTENCWGLRKGDYSW